MPLCVLSLKVRVVHSNAGSRRTRRPEYRTKFLICSIMVGFVHRALERECRSCINTLLSRFVRPTIATTIRQIGGIECEPVHTGP